MMFLTPKTLTKRKSKYNGEIEVVKTFGLPTYIQADGLTQSGGIVGSFWKSTLKRVKKRKKEVKNCLILGLGGGTVATVVNWLWSEVDVTGVDIDPLMVELGEKYLGFDRSKTKVVIGDALRYLRKCFDAEKKYDLLLVDLYNGDKYPKVFEKDSTIKLIKSCVSKDAIVVFNRLYYGEKRSMAVKFGRKLESVFEKVDYHYPEANLMFICAN